MRADANNNAAKRNIRYDAHNRKAGHSATNKKLRWRQNRRRVALRYREIVQDAAS